MIPLAAASVACLIGAHGNQGRTNPTASRVSCIDAMNPYRHAAGFTPFEIPSVKESVSVTSGGDSQTTASPHLTAVCESVQTESPRLPEVSKASAKRATYAVHVQTGQTADCTAAVDHWKKALVNFGTLPPAYTADSKLYSELQNMSFVALFNPKANAKIDCAYITCPTRKTSTQITPRTKRDEKSGDDRGEKKPHADADRQPDADPGSRNMTGQTALALPRAGRGGIGDGDGDGFDDGGDEGGNGSNLDEDKDSASPASTDEVMYEGVHLLVCASQPAALRENSKPFTEDEFKRITDSLSSSAFVAGPTLLALSAASLGLLAF
ncbi:hypothetical protein Efla_004737 [Eimeria flavescens]